MRESPRQGEGNRTGKGCPSPLFSDLFWIELAIVAAVAAILGLTA